MVDIVGNNTVKVSQESVNDRSDTMTEYCKQTTGPDFKQTEIFGQKLGIQIKEGAMLQKGPCLELQVYDGVGLQYALSYDSFHDSALGSESETPSTLRRASSTATYSNHSSDSLSTCSNADNCCEVPEFPGGIYTPPTPPPLPSHRPPSMLLNSRSRSLSASVMKKRPSAMTGVRKTSITSVLESPADFEIHQATKSSRDRVRNTDKQQLDGRRRRVESMRAETVSSPVVKIKQAWMDEKGSSTDSHLRPGFMF